MEVSSKNDQQKKVSSSNKRMGLTLLSIAVVFFLAIIIKKTLLG